MEWVVLLAFSAIAAILYKAVGTSISSTSFATKYSTNYAGQVAVLAVTFFVVLLGATVILNAATGKSLDSPVRTGGSI